VFPANVKMAIDWSTKPSWMRALAHGRLPLQISAGARHGPQPVNLRTTLRWAVRRYDRQRVSS
jgi:hypothetical protein